MNNITKKQSNKKDFLMFTLIALITSSAIICAYVFTFSSPVNALLWLSWLVLVFFLGYQTAKGKQILDFALEAKIELMKVVWPTRPETIQTTTIVMVMVTLTGFILWGVDSIMMWAIAKITHLG